MPRKCTTNSLKRVIPLNLSFGDNRESIISHLQPNTVVHVKLTLLLKSLNKNNAYTSEFIVNSDEGGKLSIVGSVAGSVGVKGVDNTGIMYLHEDNESYDFRVVVSESKKEIQSVIIVDRECGIENLIGILFTEEMRACYM